jgi:hypothetical protein
VKIKLLKKLTRINEGNKTQKNGPHKDKEICRKGVVCSWLTPDIFEDVVAMGLYNVILWGGEKLINGENDESLGTHAKSLQGLVCQGKCKDH